MLIVTEECQLTPIWSRIELFNSPEESRSTQSTEEILTVTPSKPGKIRYDKHDESTVATSNRYCTVPLPVLSRVVFLFSLSNITLTHQENTITHPHSEYSTILR